MVSTSSPGQLALVSKVPQCRPAVLGDSGPGLSSRGVDSFHGRLVPGSEGPWFRPAVQDVSRQCPSSQGVHQLSWTTQIRFEGPRHHQLSRATRARVQWPAVSIRCPEILGTVSKVPQCQSVFLGDSGLGPSARGVDQLSCVTQARVRSPTGSTCFPGHIGPLSKARGVGQMSLAI